MNTNIVTFTGKSFDLLNPTPEMVCIEDISHALANIGRFTGHTRSFYSVAQHCVIMADADLPGKPLQRLLHEVAEAYIGDISSPLKQLLCINRPDLESYIPFKVLPVREFEQKILAVIGLALGVDLSHSAEVKEADNRMYITEVRDLMPPSDEFGKWRGNLKPLNNKIIPWEPEYAEHEFRAAYQDYKGSSK